MNNKKLPQQIVEHFYSNYESSVTIALSDEGKGKQLRIQTALREDKTINTQFIVELNIFDEAKQVRITDNLELAIISYNNLNEHTGETDIVNIAKQQEAIKGVKDITFLTSNH